MRVPSSFPDGGLLLYVTESASVSGGGENSLLDLCQALSSQEHGYDVLIVGPSGPLATAARSRQISWHALGTKRWDLQLRSIEDLKQLATVIFGVIRVVRQKRPLVIHANSFEAALAAWPAAALFRNPYVIHWRGSGGLRKHSRLVLRLVSRHAIRVIVPTKAVGEYLANIGVQRAQIAIVPNPVSTVDRKRSRRVQHNAPRLLGSRTASYNETPAEILVISRAVAVKGIDVALRAFATMLDSTSPPARLILALSAGSLNEVAYVARLRTLASSLGIADYVTFLSAPVDVPALLERCDVLWNLSWEEAFGRVIVEALASGAVVVATDVGGVSEVVGPDWPYLVAAGDHRAVATMTSALISPAPAGTNDYSVDLQRFRPSVVARQLLREYRAAFLAQGRHRRERSPSSLHL